MLANARGSLFGEKKASFLTFNSIKHQHNRTKFNSSPNVDWLIVFKYRIRMKNNKICCCLLQQKWKNIHIFKKTLITSLCNVGSINSCKFQFIGKWLERSKSNELQTTKESGLTLERDTTTHYSLLSLTHTSLQLVFPLWEKMYVKILNHNKY